MHGSTAPAPSVPPLARDQWEKHPNYPRQVLLLGSHEGFRGFSERLIEAAAAGRSVSEISRLYHYWMGAMRGHEGYEERKLYPFLERRFGVQTASMRAGHGALHDKQHDVEQRLLRVPERAELDFEDARTDLVTGLRAYDGTLRAHLELEEDLVIPALLALSPQEFRQYYAS